MAALEEAQRLARLGNWEVNLVDGATWWSTGMYRLFERDPGHAPPSPEEFIGCVHPDDRARVRADIGNPQAHLRGSVSQHRQLAADGSVRHMVANFRVDTDAAGRPSRLFGTLQDITEQVEADRRVRASQDQLAAVLAAVPDLWFVVDAERRFAEVSAQVHPDLVIPWGTLRGRPFELVPRPAGPQPGADPLLQAREAGPVCSFDYTTAAAPGQPERAYEARIVAMPDGQWLYLSRDISERKRTEQALARNRDELEAIVRDRTRQLTAARDVAERANRAKSEFLSRMSHELRTPMNAVLGFAQLLALDATLASRPREFLDHIMRAGKHLLHLINDVLDLAHVESGRMSLSPEPLPIDDILREVIALMKPLALQHGVTIELAALPDAVVRGDRLRVKQVLLNLLSNAIKYNRPGGWVRIGGEPAAPGMQRVVVADSGQGIGPEGMAQLFEPFARLGAEHGAIEGTGIGLSITRRLVEMMGGAVGATSQAGVGSRFWIDLPTDRLAAAPALPVEPETAEGAALGDRPACVLYVEDNPANLALVQQIVDRHAGVRMISAPSGTLGFGLAISHRPDLILLDIHLPDMSGHAVLQKLRAHPETRTIPVVAVTANAMPDDAARAREAGFDEYMTKPLDIRRFDAMLQRLLQRRSASETRA
jgi:signal transduction histidine kinase/CheY-like chemotaxis protein